MGMLCNLLACSLFMQTIFLPTFSMNSNPWQIQRQVACLKRLIILWLINSKDYEDGEDDGEDDVSNYRSHNVCGSCIVPVTLLLWTQMSLVQILCRCQYSMRLDRLHGAQGSTKPSFLRCSTLGTSPVEHQDWVWIIETGCESIRPFELCLHG